MHLFSICPLVRKKPHVSNVVGWRKPVGVPPDMVSPVAIITAAVKSNSTEE